jgi:hypothetical protein
MQRVFLPGADIHVSIGLGTILGRPTGAAIPSGDFGDILAEEHDVTFVQFGVFFALGVVMFDRMKMRWRDYLVFVPRTDVMRSVSRGGDETFDRSDDRSDGGISDIGHNVMKRVEMVEYLIKHFNFLWNEKPFLNEYQFFFIHSTTTIQRPTTFVPSFYGDLCECGDDDDEHDAECETWNF